MAIPVAMTTNLSRKTIRSWYETNLENLPVDSRLRSFIPKETVSLCEEGMQSTIDLSKRNPLCLGVRLNSGWHQVQRLITAKDFPEPIP